MKIKEGCFFIFLFLPVASAFGENRSDRGDILLQRAKEFESLGLYSIAREQYKWIHSEYLKKGKIALDLDRVSSLEAQARYEAAEKAFKRGAPALAEWECQKVLEISPNHPGCRRLDNQIQSSIRIEARAEKHVSSLYQEGIAFYEKERWGEALACFVKVVNMSPSNKGALRYIERIGQRMEAVK